MLEEIIKNIMRTSENKIQYITCPNCGAEYLPCEIYYPKSFLGDSRQIDKINGKIDSFNGTSMDLEEQYVCDHCNSKFKVSAKISFKTQIADKYDFDKSYVTPLFDDKLTLSEDF